MNLHPLKLELRRQDEDLEGYVDRIVRLADKHFTDIQQAVNTNDRIKEWEYFEPAPVNGVISIRIPHYPREIKAIKFGCVSGSIDLAVRVGDMITWTNINWRDAGGITLSAAVAIGTDVCVDGTGKMKQDDALLLVFSNNAACTYICVTIITG